MIRALALCLVLAGCVTSADNGFREGFTGIAAQRMQFTAEAVCLNNTTRRTQERALRDLGFPHRIEQDDSVIYANPGTLTFVRLGPTEPQGFVADDGSARTVPAREGCSVGSPAVGTRIANQLAGEILAPRLVDGSDLLTAPLGAGTDQDGGAGFFFESLALTLPTATTIFPDPETGALVSVNHPVILIVHL